MESKITVHPPLRTQQKLRCASMVNVVLQHKTHHMGFTVQCLGKHFVDLGSAVNIIELGNS